MFHLNTLSKILRVRLCYYNTCDPSPIIAQGECEGNIIYEERGENGFGYDSLFLAQKRRTFAELETVEKRNLIIGEGISCFEIKINCLKCG